MAHKKFETLTSEQKFDICQLYKQAKHPEEQIGICADLHNISKETVMRVLAEGGVLNVAEEPEKAEKPDEPVMMQSGTRARDVLARAEIVLALVQPHDTTAIVQKLADLAADLVREDATALIYGGMVG